MQCMLMQIPNSVRHSTDHITLPLIEFNTFELPTERARERARNCLIGIDGRRREERRREEGEFLLAPLSMSAPELSSYGHLSEGEWSYSRTGVRLHLEAKGHLHSRNKNVK